MQLWTLLRYVKRTNLFPCKFPHIHTISPLASRTFHEMKKYYSALVFSQHCVDTPSCDFHLEHIQHLPRGNRLFNFSELSLRKSVELKFTRWFWLPSGGGVNIDWCLLNCKAHWSQCDIDQPWDGGLLQIRFLHVPGIPSFFFKFRDLSQPIS